MKRSLRFIATSLMVSLLTLSGAACSDDETTTGPDVTRDVGQDADTTSTPDSGDTTTGDTGKADAADISEAEDISDAQEPSDAGDTETQEDALADAGDTDDTGEPDGADADLPETCEGECTEQTLSIEYAGKTGNFEHAHYGFSSPATSSSGEWQIHLEAWDGPPEGCPVESSPTTNWTLVVAGLVMPLDPGTRTKAEDNLFGTFFDYDGRFLGARPAVPASDVTITPVAAKIDLDRIQAGQQDDEGFIALDFNATFDDGTISGHIFATHCLSMDVL